MEKIQQVKNKPSDISPEIEGLIRNTRLDTPAYRSELATLTPAKQSKAAWADLQEVRTIKSVSVDSIDVIGPRREVRNDAVETIMASMASIGLRTPISVRYYGERPENLSGDSVDAIVLMTGAHRLEAAKRLGWDEIECFFYYHGDQTDARLWELAENLHRSDLTALERSDQIAEWIRLNESKVSSQAETKPQGGRPESGVNAAARELGVQKMDAHRAVKVAGLSEEAKEAAREAGLDDNRTALLEAAKNEEAADQVAALKARKAEREAQQALHDRQRDEARAAFPQSIQDREEAKQQAIATRKAKPVDLDALQAENEELREANASLITEVETLKAELKKFDEMRVQFEQGGFDKVIAGKDNEIRVLETRVYTESDEKIKNLNSAEKWRKRAIEAGWSNDVVIDIPGRPSHG